MMLPRDAQEHEKATHPTGYHVPRIEQQPNLTLPHVPLGPFFLCLILFAEQLEFLQTGTLEHGVTEPKTKLILGLDVISFEPMTVNTKSRR